ncbi:hypothetical protein [Streptomyces violascens]|uniref:Uncharacterized protein n=1 Tax=Streptomyces violascens TaxID=67381 RepID=A0ABQ3QTS6_9ACTN|nr:hypothetical protein [Streptomyces violascens]GHI40683.1 hypothetical protein Sviol_50910 [Streptomyces violascens]
MTAACPCADSARWFGGSESAAARIIQAAIDADTRHVDAVGRTTGTADSGYRGY